MFFTKTYVRTLHARVQYMYLITRNSIHKDIMNTLNTITPNIIKEIYKTLESDGINLVERSKIRTIDMLEQIKKVSSSQHQVLSNIELTLLRAIHIFKPLVRKGILSLNKKEKEKEREKIKEKKIEKHKNKRIWT
eukprot:GHVR01124807.1.p1 GENE.GHVR01124807.1~~GHVR01124807.1.p1  ORF type:complete len:135 (+),score=10.20 GHVR01124807.1:574-978(+)